MPIGPIRRTKSPAFNYLYQKARTSYEEIPLAGQAIMDRLDKHLDAHGIRPTGPVVWTYEHGKDGRTVLLRAGIPVPPRTPAGKFTLEKIPAWNCYQTLYKGPYPKLAHAWSEFEDKVKEKGLAGPILNRDIYRKMAGVNSSANVTVLQIRIGKP